MPEKQYTIGEEIANSISHTLGVLFSIYAIVILAVSSNNGLEATTSAIYGATMFILFQSSACYHAITNVKAKKVFQKIDHSAIYVLIAGTYTPILLLVVDFPLSVALLAMTWYLAITGIIYSCLTLKFKYLSKTSITLFFLLYRIRFSNKKAIFLINPIFLYNRDNDNNFL